MPEIPPAGRYDPKILKKNSRENVMVKPSISGSVNRMYFIRSGCLNSNEIHVYGESS